MKHEPAPHGRAVIVHGSQRPANVKQNRAARRAEAKAKRPIKPKGD